MKKLSKKKVEVKVERIMSVAAEGWRVMYALFKKNDMEVTEISFVIAMLLDHLMGIVQRQNGDSYIVVKNVIMGTINQSLDTINKMREEDE